MCDQSLSKEAERLSLRETGGRRSEDVEVLDHQDLMGLDFLQETGSGTGRYFDK